MSDAVQRDSGPPAAAPQRRLAFFYHPHSFSVFALREAAREICELVWVIDSEIEGTETMVPMLRRMGTVVDLAGCSVGEGADLISAECPDGILTLKDSLMQRTGALAELLGLPFHSPDVAQRFTDKHVQRAVMRDAGIPGPGFWTVPDPGDELAWESFAADARFPAVLKPRLGSEGSRDTVRVGSVEEVRDACGQEDQADGAHAELVLEEYLGDRERSDNDFADYVSVETIVSDGVISHLAVTGRFPTAEPFRESGFFIDAELSDEDRRGALELAEAAVRGLGVRIGCLHTEIKFTPDGPRVIELNGRIGGGVPEMLLDATGVELLPIALRLALGESISFDAPPPTNRVAYLLYVQSPVWMRTVTSVDGLKELSADPAVSELILNRGPGQNVHWREGNHGHVFSVRGVVADHDALRAFERRVHDEVTIAGEGESDPVEDAGSGSARAFESL
jgi:biotin carboxylase